MKKGILVFATIFLVLLFFLAPAVDAGWGILKVVVVA